MPDSNSSQHESSGEFWKESFQAYLEETRKSETQVKKKKLDVKAGKSYTTGLENEDQDTLQEEEEEENDENVVDDPEEIDISTEESENDGESDFATDTNNSKLIDENVHDNLEVGNYVGVNLTYGMGRNKSGIKTFGAKVMSINGDYVTLKYLIPKHQIFTISLKLMILVV